jgi:hypothetical protein
MNTKVFFLLGLLFLQILQSYINIACSEVRTIKFKSIEMFSNRCYTNDTLRNRIVNRWLAKISKELAVNILSM